MPPASAPGGFQTFAVIITQNPDIAVLRSLLDEVRRAGHPVIVVDNASANREELERLGPDLVDELVLHESNVGISGRLNDVLARRELGGLMLYLDQDSRITESEITALVRSAQRHAAGLGQWSPQYIDASTGQVGYSSRRMASRPATPIGSGSVYALDACRSVGGFDEGLPLDLCDFDMAIRLQDGGYDVVIDESIVVRHTVGRRRSLGWRVAAECHPAWRYWTKSAALRRVAVRHVLHHPRWVVKMAAGRVIETVQSAVLARDPRILAEAAKGLVGIRSAMVPEALLSAGRRGPSDEW